MSSTITALSPIGRRLIDVELRDPRHDLPARVAVAAHEDVARPTWQHLVGHEPRLADLLADVRAVTDSGDPGFFASKVWYDRFKPRLVRLMGNHWEAVKDAVLHKHRLREMDRYDALVAETSARYRGML